MALSKLDLAVAATVAAGLFWVEHDHRIVVATPATAEVAPPKASVCPNTDDVPFSADCIRFIAGGMLPDPRVAVTKAARALNARLSERAAMPGSACPASNENAPYSAQCIRFISGWFWQAYPAESAP